MKLVPTIAYFIKNGPQKFFKQLQPPKSIEYLNQDTQSNKKFFKRGVGTQKANIQMKMGNIKNSKIEVKQEKQVVSNTKKSFFTKRIQQQRVEPAAEDPSIIENVSKAESQSRKITKLLKYTQFSMELFNIHRKYYHLFTPKHYEHLFLKLNFSAQHPEIILSYRFKKKDSTNQQTKEKVQLLTKEETTNHPFWKEIIQEIMNKMQGTKDLTTLNAYLPTFMSIQKCFNFIPAEIYQYILARNALANFQELTQDQISNLVHLLKYNNRLRPTNGIEYDANQLGQSQSVKIDAFIQRLASEIINNPEKYTKMDFLNVFVVVSKRKKRMNILPLELLNKSQISILKYCDELSFENIYTYMKIYVFFHKNPNQVLLKTLMTHLYQKSLSETNQYSLLMTLHAIKNRQLILKNLKEIGTVEQSIHLQAKDLAIRLAQQISQKMKFRQIQIIQFLSSCFQNEITDRQVLSVISNQLIKQSKELSLQRLGKGVFKLHLLGGRSQQLIKKVMDQYEQRYQDCMVKSTKDQAFSIPVQSSNILSSLNFKQIHLQQCLIMLIWTACQYYDRKTVAKRLNSIYPSRVESMDPLIIQLVQNINAHSPRQQSVANITYKFTPNVFPEGRLAEFYRHQSAKSKVELLMWEQASLTCKFLANYNIEQRKFLPQRWSSISVYRIEDYMTFCLKSSNQSCFFDQKTQLSLEFFKRRQKIIKSLTESKQESKCFSSNPLDKII